MKLDKNDWLIFLLGLFSMTQIKIIGYIGISELICYFIAPHLFMRHNQNFKKWGMLPYIYFIGLWMIFSILSFIKNNNDFILSLKAIAPVYSLFAVSVCAFVLLVDKYNRIKWFLIGFFLSSILSIFIFQPGYGVVNMAGEELIGEAAVDNIISYKLFWVDRISKCVLLPVQAFYLNIPFGYSLIAVFAITIYSLLSGARSAFISFAFSLFLILTGRSLKKNPLRVKFKKNKVILLTCCFLTFGFVGKQAYVFATRAGYLGEAEEIKLSNQSKQGTSVLNLLMSGRGETFIGLFACLDKPIMGWGVYPIDPNNQYTLDFLAKYGNELDYKHASDAALKGENYIPAHSYIISAWVCNGLGGLFFWLYILWILFLTIRENMYVIPEFFGWFTLTIPKTFWMIFFSPFGERVGTSVFIICMLLAKAARKQQMIDTWRQL